MASIVFEYGQVFCPNRCKEITRHQFEWEVVEIGLPLIDSRRYLVAVRCTRCHKLNSLMQRECN